MIIHDEIEQRLSSKTRMRSLFKDCSIEEMHKIISRMSDILEEKRAEKDRAEEERKQKAAEIEAVKQLLEEKGLSLEDLGSAQLAKSKKRRNVQTYTFEYTTEAGDAVQWEGGSMGRVPSQFKAYLDRTGKKRLECII